MTLTMTTPQARALLAAARAGAMQYRHAIENHPTMTEQAKGLTLSAFDRVMAKLESSVKEDT